MGLPRWSEVNEKFIALKENVEKFKENHPSSYKFYQEAFITLPPPFNVICQNIWDGFEGKEE